MIFKNHNALYITHSSLEKTSRAQEAAKGPVQKRESRAGLVKASCYNAHHFTSSENHRV